MHVEREPIHRDFFEYDDYRDLLGELIRRRKSAGLPCSYRWMAQQAGYTSPNFFKLVVDRHRELTAEGAERVVAMFKLGLAEGDYFRTLVQFQRAKDLSSKVDLAEKLVRLKPRRPSAPLARDQFDYHRKWAYVVLRETLTLDAKFRDAADLVRQVNTGLTPAQVEDGLAHLEKLGLIARDADGHLRVRHQTLRSGDRIVNSALFGFHLDILDLAKQALGKYRADEREFHGLTLRLTPDAYEVARRRIQAFKDELLELSAAADSADAVFQLNLQLFPVARLKTGRGNA